MGYPSYAAAVGADGGEVSFVEGVGDGRGVGVRAGWCVSGVAWEGLCGACWRRRQVMM